MRFVPERSQLLGRIRLFAVYLFIAGLVALSRPTPALLGLGAAFALAGESVRVWAAGHLRKSVELATAGPYAHTQNPLYLGRLLILTGLGLAARAPHHLNLLALAIGYGIFFLYYMPRKLRVEGARLAGLHGETFDRYNRAVPVLFPSLRPYAGRARVPWSFGRMVRNQEPLVAAGLLLAFGVLAWRCSLP